MYKRFHEGISALSKTFNIDSANLIRVWTRIYLQRLEGRGKKDAVKFMKELNTVAERYALHQEIKPIPWTKSDNEGFPKILNPFKTYLRSKDTKLVIISLSIMRTCEVLRLPISQEIDTVIDPCRSDSDVKESLIKFIPTWVKSIPTLNLGNMDYHLTVKNGPNGHALKSSDSDIKALINSPELLEAIQVVQTKLSDSHPVDTNVDLQFLEGKQCIHSKLTQFPEKAGKTRTIAIIDYYSQRCLKPLHDGLMHLLSHLVSDGTYSHFNVGKYAEQKTKEKSFIYCADLSAATDRFPAEVQEVLLHELIQDCDLANSIWTLLAKRTFKLAWSDETVTYNCGQPMGAYGSWPLFALAHHLVVEYAASTAKTTAIKQKYRLIGDDVIITDERTAQNYQHIMKALGLTINEGKTVLSPQSSTYSGAEVAKQLYLNGKCLTPITPGLVKDLIKPYMFNSCMKVLMNRYEFIVPNSLSMLINELYRKEKSRKLVWVLCSDPVDGVIKPENSGYNESSPWVSTKVDDYQYEYSQVFMETIGDIAFERSGLLLSRQFGTGGPWQDQTHPEPQCIKYVVDNIRNKLSEVIEHFEMSFEDIDEFMELVAYIPDPDVPFMERTKLKQKRLSSFKTKVLAQLSKRV